MSEPFASIDRLRHRGRRVARLLMEQPQPPRRSGTGRPLDLRRVIVREPAKPAGSRSAAGTFTTDLQTVLTDSRIHVGVELPAAWTGLGTPCSISWRRQAGVTANKALLAEHGSEVFAAALSMAGPLPSRPASWGRADRWPSWAVPGRQSNPVVARHPQRHEQFHSHRHERTGP